MAKYVVLRFEIDSQADTLVEDCREYPDSDILTPAQENNVRGEVVAVWSAAADGA